MANIAPAQTISISSNVGYTIPILYDQYVAQANIQESLSNVAYPRLSTTATASASTELAYQLVPYVTYVVSDGAPILLVTTYNVQYWSMA